MLMAEVEKVMSKLKSWILEGQSGMLAEWTHASRDAVRYTEVLYSKMLQEMLEKVSPNSGDARALRGFSRLCYILPGYCAALVVICSSELRSWFSNPPTQT